MSCILKKEYKIVSVILTICFLFMMFFKQSYAAEHIASVSIPITQTLTVHGQTQNHYQSTYQLKALNNDCPMPESSQNRVYQFSMNDSDQTQLSMTYTHAGIYSYSLVQNANDQLQYDKSLYQIDVYVKNTDNNGLIASTVVYLENGNKTDQIHFQNVLNIETTSTNNKPIINTSAQTNTSTKSPQTSDNIELGGWIFMMVLAASGIVGLITTKKHRKTNI